MSDAVQPWSNTTTSKYQPIRELAKGGMGRVHLAVRQEGAFRRVYAVKRLLAQHHDDDIARDMFLEEARLAGLIHHPNVVSVIDVGQDEQGPYLVMDFVEGISLSHLIDWSSEAKVPVPVQLAVRLIRDAADGLHAAHELAGHDGEPLNLVHRDVSPQNILLGYDGLVRLTDFGVAKALGRSMRTSTGILKGKAGYMSPEQLQFEEPDRRSDLFSLGVVFYELLAGQRLYGGGEVAKAAKRILREPPPDIEDVRRDVHPVLVELLFKMMAKAPEHRPQNAREVSTRLTEVLNELLLAEPPILLRDFLEEHFAEYRVEQREKLENAADEATGDSMAPLSFAATVPLGTRDRARSHGVRWALAVGLLAVGVAIGGAVSWLTRVEPGPVVTTPAEVAKTAPSTEATSTTTDSKAPTVDSPAAELSAGELPVERSKPEADSVADETKPARTKSRRKSKRTKKRSRRGDLVEWGQPL